ncbi:MAG: IPT/TIG domain-containing protein [Ignavibacteriaceae bacterium]|nr:IPT/TIG domain-containing protein [Ignavibacteriaceae bacterium]
MKNFNINTLSSYTRIMMISIFVVITFLGCNEEDKVTSLWNGDYTPLPAPVITSISPATQGLAGIEEVTITGTNFSPNVGENFVYFGNTKGTVLQATTTSLLVKAPNVTGDSLNVRVVVQNALSTSNAITYKLLSAFRVVVEFGTGTTPSGITFDNAGNMYYFLGGIKKITPSGDTSSYAPKGAETFWASLKFGPDGALYAARSVAGIFRIMPGATPASWVTSSAGIGSTNDFDFDQNQNMWAAGNATIISRIKPDKSVKTFPSPAFVVRGVRVYNGYLYLSGRKDNKEGIWRAEILPNEDLGAIEPYFDFAAAGYSGDATSLAVSTDGVFYLGVNTQLNAGVEHIIVVRADGTSNILYPGVLEPKMKSKCQSLFWGPGQNIYYVRQIANPTEPPKEAIVEVYIGKTSAPYFGN